MHIYSINDPEFAPYGRIVEGIAADELLEVLEEQTPLPEEGTKYLAEDETLMALDVEADFWDRIYGGMPVQLGWCNGHNTKLNCLEYHRDSEINLGTEDFILLLGQRCEIEKDGMFDTAKVKAFRVPAGVLIEVYATTLHFAPCSAAPGRGFKVLVVLPRGTNLAKPDIVPQNDEDQLLWARNKWLLAHAESAQAGRGAAVRLRGENVDLSAEL